MLAENWPEYELVIVSAWPGMTTHPVILVSSFPLRFFLTLAVISAVVNVDINREPFFCSIEFSKIMLAVIYLPPVFEWYVILEQDVNGANTVSTANALSLFDLTDDASTIVAEYLLLLKPPVASSIIYPNAEIDNTSLQLSISECLHVHDSQTSISPPCSTDDSLILAPSIVGIYLCEWHLCLIQCLPPHCHWIIWCILCGGQRAIFDLVIFITFNYSALYYRIVIPSFEDFLSQDHVVGCYPFVSDKIWMKMGSGLWLWIIHI